MEQTGTVAQDHNYLIVALAGDQTYVKVFDAQGDLIRESQTRGVHTLQQMANPGEYKIETDGTIQEIRSEQRDLSIPFE